MKDKLDLELKNYFSEEIYPQGEVKEAISDAVKKAKAGEFKANSRGKKPLKEYLRYVASAAAVLLIIFTIFEYDTVSAAIKKAFAFIPGIGIVKEEDNSIIYYMQGEAITVENEDLTLTLNQVYVTKEGVTASYHIEMKKITGEDFEALGSQGEKMPEDKAVEEMKKLGYDRYFTFEQNEIGWSITPKVALNTDEGRYEQEGGYWGGGFTTFTGSSWYDTSKEQWSLEKIYEIACGDLSINFALRNYETYESAEEVGATQIKNDISLTAVPSWSDNKLTVDMYNNNFSSFSRVSGYESSMSEDISRKPYITIGDDVIYSEPISGYGTTLEFDLSGLELTEELKAQTLLHIPTITVLQNENAKLKLRVSKDGEDISYPDTLEFKNSTLYIKDIKKIQEGSSNKDERLRLLIDFKYAGDNMEIEMFTGILVNGEGSGYTWYKDKETGYMALEISSDIPLYKIRSIKFINTEYTINDEYRLLLK